MTPEEVRSRVCEVIADHLDVYEEMVTPDASLVDDLGADSLDAVELAMALEFEFKIEINDDEMEKLNRVEDVVKHVQQLVLVA